jgi:GH25 family lysozyme M1 (1,4-beta-N-acetylmuramidase)
MKFNPVIVDLSHFDDVQDWNAVKKFGILGVINKATEGLGMIDKTFSIRRKPAADTACSMVPTIS